MSRPKPFSKEEESYIKNKCEKSIYWLDWIEEFKTKFKIKKTDNAIRRKIQRMGYTITEQISIRDTVESIPDRQHILTTVNKELAKKVKELQTKRRIEETLITLVENKITSLPKVKIPIYKTSSHIKHKQQEAGLLLSDLHVGEVVSSEETFGLGKYDFNIFKLRMEFLSDVISDICINTHKIKKLNVLALGDFVSGIIKDELVDTGEGTVVEWVFGCSMVVAQFLMELAQVFEEINVDCIFGNHGRLSQEVRFKKRYVNWDYIMYNILSLMTMNQKNIKYKIHKSFFALKDILGHKFLMLHGDNIKGWNGIPWYGINRAAHRLAELLQAKKHNFDYICLAHFHNNGELDSVKGEKFINGSLIGGNEYSIGKMFTSSDPKQKLFGVHPRVGVSWRYPINLDFANLKKKPRYIYDPEIIPIEQIKNLINF